MTSRPRTKSPGPSDGCWMGAGRRFLPGTGGFIRLRRGQPVHPSPDAGRSARGSHRDTPGSDVPGPARTVIVAGKAPAGNGPRLLGAFLFLRVRPRPADESEHLRRRSPAGRWPLGLARARPSVAAGSPPQGSPRSKTSTSRLYRRPGIASPRHSLGERDRRLEVVPDPPPHGSERSLVLGDEPGQLHPVGEGCLGETVRSQRPQHLRELRLEEQRSGPGSICREATARRPRKREDADEDGEPGWYHHRAADEDGFAHVDLLS